MDTTLQNLLALRELLDDPNHWTKHTSARDINGLPVRSGMSPTAVCWCLSGAVFKITNTTHEFLTLVDLLAVDKVEGIAAFNDDNNTTHRMVIDRIEHTIFDYWNSVKAA